MSSARPVLAGLALIGSVALAGCNAERTPSMASTARSAAPLSPQLVSLMSERGMSPTDPMLVRVFKEESKAEVWKKRRADGRYALLKSYDICRFSGKLGPKIKEGDKQAPEGFYSVTPAQMNPKSSYYLSFNIGYPNAYDRSLGRNGTHVMMHGDCLSAGCYAMTDTQMGEIYAMARESFRGGQKAFQVQALPFRMTAQNIARRRDDKNMKFWKNLKQGSDHFEVTKLEPKVDACGKRYVFNAQTGPFSQINPDGACPTLAVDPQIAKAVGAKEKADNILIAQMSKTEAIAPEYVAQNGRLRRTLDQPVIAVAAVQTTPNGALVAQPATGQAAVLAGGPTVTGSTMGASPAQTVALSTPSDGRSAASADGKAGPFARMFRSDRDEAPAAPAETVVASGKPAPLPPAKSSGPREIAVDQAPVMASSVGSERPGAGTRLKSWMGGLFGSKPEEPPAAQPAETVPAAYTPPAAAPQPRKNRQASLPEQFAPKRTLDPRVTSAFAAFD